MLHGNDGHLRSGHNLLDRFVLKTASSSHERGMQEMQFVRKRIPTFSWIVPKDVVVGYDVVNM